MINYLFKSSRIRILLKSNSLMVKHMFVAHKIEVQIFITNKKRAKFSFLC